MTHFALQLYTVRDHIERDLASALSGVKKAGYDYVEIAGFAGLSPSVFKDNLEIAGLTPVSSHFGLEETTTSPDSIIETCRALDVRHAVIPAAHEKEAAGWQKVGKSLDEAGSVLREAGIRLSYHNHAHEFVLFDGKYALDILMDAASPEHLAAQIDTFWVQHAGVDPVDVINKYAGRCPLIHVKDRAPEGEEPIWAPVGHGTMTWAPILEATRNAGAEWYIVEQDLCKGDSLEAARLSAEYMASL